MTPNGRPLDDLLDRLEHIVLDAPEENRTEVAILARWMYDIARELRDIADQIDAIGASVAAKWERTVTEHAIEVER